MVLNQSVLVRVHIKHLNMVQYSTVKHVQLEQCFFVISLLSFVKKQSLVVKLLQVKYCQNYCTKTKPVNHSKLFFLRILY